MNAIVITTINPPTKAVLKYAGLKNFKLIIVGDRKTPATWATENCNYLGIDSQDSFQYEIVKYLPENHYSRKMVGYIFAVHSGAKWIHDTDDDNIPMENFDLPLTELECDVIVAPQDFINIYNCFTGLKIWPRGLPLENISNSTPDLQISKRKVEVGIWQGLADGEPDVDAIYRLTSDERVTFNRRDPIVLDNDVITPFNSQNTFFRRELFPLMYLPTTVSFRFTDILRSLVAQPIIWNSRFHLGFTEATVFQERNPHNLLKDFESEIPMYLNLRKAIDVAKKMVKAKACICENLLHVYEGLTAEQIVSSGELISLKAWLNDVSTCHETLTEGSIEKIENES